MSNPVFPYGTTSSYIGLTEDKQQWVPFVHFADNHIYRLVLPEVFDFDSFINVPWDGPPPMPNSPIAVASWGTDNPQVHLYYFTNDSTLQELFWARGHMDTPFVVATNLGPVVRGSTTLYATLVADGDALGQIRVGYQSPSDPTTITESVYSVSSGKWTSRTYPKLMS